MFNHQIRFSLYFIAEIFGKIHAMWIFCSKNSACIQNWKYLFEIPLNWTIVLSAFGWVLYSFSLQCDSKLLSNCRWLTGSSSSNIGSENAPDNSHYFSRFIGKSYCRVIIIIVVTFKALFIRLAIPHMSENLTKLWHGLAYKYKANQ